MKRMSRIFLLLGITALIHGCKLAVILVEGGEVQSTCSGTCVVGSICIFEVTDPNFSKTFTANPSDGCIFKSGIRATDFSVPILPIRYVLCLFKGTKKAKR